MPGTPGIDVSRYQGEIDWKKVAAAGYKFAVIRATVGDYYTDRRIPVATKLVEVPDFTSSLAQETQKDLLALWMGKKSLLDRFVPRGWVEELISTSPTSVLVLR